MPSEGKQNQERKDKENGTYLLPLFYVIVFGSIVVCYMMYMTYTVMFKN